MMNIEARHVDKSYAGRAVLRDFSAVFPEGATTVITGPSGAGKTTLLRLVLGLLRPDAGDILGTKGRRMAAVFQEDRLCEGLSVRRNLLLVRPDLPSDMLREHLVRVGLPGEERTRVRELSGGMRRRAAIVRAMAAGADVVVLDEPLRGLDAETKTKVLRYLAQETAGRTVLLVTHDEEEASALGARNRIKLDKTERTEVQ